MNTDEYTTYKCDGCGKHKPIDQVHAVPLGVAQEPKWLCRMCIVNMADNGECVHCGSDDPPLYAFGAVIFCGPCIAEMPTVHDAIKRDGPSIYAQLLGTDEPKDEAPYVKRGWAEFVERGT